MTPPINKSADANPTETPFAVGEQELYEQLDLCKSYPDHREMKSSLDAISVSCLGVHPWIDPAILP